MNERLQLTGGVARLEGKRVDEQVEEDRVPTSGTATRPVSMVMAGDVKLIRKLTSRRSSPSPRSRAPRRVERTRCGACSPRLHRYLLGREKMNLAVIYTDQVNTPWASNKSRRLEYLRGFVFL